MNAMQEVQSRPTGSLSPDLLEKMRAYWRAANYLSVGQISESAVNPAWNLR
jgi:phosphoketolase